MQDNRSIDRSLEPADIPSLLLTRQHVGIPIETNTDILENILDDISKIDPDIVENILDNISKIDPDIVKNILDNISKIDLEIRNNIIDNFSKIDPEIRKNIIDNFRKLDINDIMDYFRTSTLSFSPEEFLEFLERIELSKKYDNEDIQA